MIDREARNHLAELIRALVSGAISNDEFEDGIPASGDKAISEIFGNGAWCLYSDSREYRLKGKFKLSKMDKRMVACWVLFLKSEFEYKWPTVPIGSRILHFISFGLVGRSQKEAWQSYGDINFWPFKNDDECNKAKQGTGYLGKDFT